MTVAYTSIYPRRFFWGSGTWALVLAIQKADDAEFTLPRPSLLDILLRQSWHRCLAGGTVPHLVGRYGRSICLYLHIDGNDEDYTTTACEMYSFL